MCTCNVIKCTYLHVPYACGSICSLLVQIFNTNSAHLVCENINSVEEPACQKMTRYACILMPKSAYKI